MRLELHATRELQLTWVRGTIRERTAANGAAILDISIWVAKVDVIERIEPISPQDEGDRLANLEILLQRKIRVEEVWSEYGIASSIPKGVHSRQREALITSCRQHVFNQ